MWNKIQIVAAINLVSYPNHVRRRNDVVLVSCPSRFVLGVVILPG
jgi:hypothetical protein